MIMKLMMKITTMTSLAILMLIPMSAMAQTPGQEDLIQEL